MNFKPEVAQLAARSTQRTAFWPDIFRKSVMKKFSIYLFALLLFSCNNSSDSSAENKDSGTVRDEVNSSSSHKDYSGCYRQVVGRDSILLQIDQHNDGFTGKMEFDNFEKDASHGTVKGQMQDGNIVLWYDFNSEGMHSVMEVVLRPVSSGLIRGLADVTNRGDTALLRHDKLNFDPANTLEKFDCSAWH